MDPVPSTSGWPLIAPRVQRVLAFGEPLPLRPALRVAACAGGIIKIEADPARVVEQAAGFDPAVVLFHYDHGGPASLLLLRRLRQVCPRAALILLAHPSPPAGVEQLLDEPWFSHLLALESPWFMEELGITLAKLDGADIFGLERYLPWGTRFASSRLSSSNDKGDVLDRIDTFMGTMGVSGRMVHHLQTVADEMLMNAIYDAPLDDEGRPRYASQARRAGLKLLPHERPTVRFGSDGRRFGISVTDPFGGLSVDILRRYVAKGVRRGEDQIDRKPGGAGLGLYMLFTHLHSLCLNLAPGRCTEVIGLVDIRGSFRDVRGAPRSVNCFVSG